MYSIDMILKFQGVSTNTNKITSPSGEIISFEKFNFSGIKKIWSLLVKSHSEYSEKLVIEEYLLIQGKFSEIGEMLNDYNSSEFNISFVDHEGTIEYGNNSTKEISRVKINFLITSEDDAEKWLTPFIDEGLLIQARIYDKEYDFWQNAYDPLQFKANNKSYKGLPMISNNLPPPLNQEIIDTSQNPGRLTIKHGYIEFIGSVVWIKKQLLVSLNVYDKILELNENWLEVSRLNHDVFKLKVADSPFNNDKDDSITIQNKLRSILYEAGAHAEKNRTPIS